MFIRSRCTAAVIVVASLAGPLHAQDQPAPAAAPAPAPTATPPGDAPSQAAPAAGVDVPTLDPKLSVATVRLENGARASKVIGAAVYNDQNQQIGTVDDLILNHDNQVIYSVVSVGGFLGVGGKLVAVPFKSLHTDDKGKVSMPEASKDALAKMPSFTYGG